MIYSGNFCENCYYFLLLQIHKIWFYVLLMLTIFFQFVASYCDCSICCFGSPRLTICVEMHWCVLD